LEAIVTKTAGGPPKGHGQREKGPQRTNFNPRRESGSLTKAASHANFREKGKKHERPQSDCTSNGEKGKAKGRAHATKQAKRQQPRRKFNREVSLGVREKKIEDYSSIDIHEEGRKRAQRYLHRKPVNKRGSKG